MSNAFETALVVHVWYLDLLDEMAEAAAHLPDDTACFVTFPDSFTAAQRDAVATAFPGAQLVAVENRGQDIGALFQLMQQVDLTRYGAICKIHTKKGPNVPETWRRALLDGVLGSKAGVEAILARFRADPAVMLAGARQLYLHGPSHLDGNAAIMQQVFGPLIGAGDVAGTDWGFIAGTCFWIRPALLRQMAACQPEFPPADYVTDGLPAHAAERVFGLAVARQGGKVLLQDLRFPDRAPEVIEAWAPDLPAKKQRMTQILTPLVVHGFLQPRWHHAPLPALQPRRRVAVFASYSSDGFLPPQVLPYLAGLKELVSTVVVVCDNDLDPAERARLAGLADHVIAGRHGEYDFGSYKRGIGWLRDSGHLATADALVLCNDSCYGPVGSFAPMFARMEARGVDFWGATESREIGHHLQSFFVVLNRNAFESQAFRDFIAGVAPQKTVQDVIRKYEIGLTRTLVAAGFTPAALLANELAGPHPADPSYANPTRQVLYGLARGLPLVKAKALHHPSDNYNGVAPVIDWLRQHAPPLHAAVQDDDRAMQLADAGAIRFSVIMPSFNRAWCIGRAIDALLAQSHQNFELIIVDDGSTDGTDALLRQRYGQEIDNGRIVYIPLARNVGVSRARNIGLAHASADWIAYADTDNEVRPCFLSVMAHAIRAEPDRDAVNARMLNVNSGTQIGIPFETADIVRGNFIDLGVFIHRRSLVNRFGGFDDSLRRLVDWDLCIRYTRHQAPAWADPITLDYIDEERDDRISVSESYLKADIQVRRKHSPKPTVSTIIPSYNHRDFIVEAIESALAQEGDFHHEILLSDDGSTDGTQRIFRHYAAKYPKSIRNISRGGNHGIASNYRHCFHEAEGEFVAVLEGDDYWTDPQKLQKQIAFLQADPGASMVFSRIELLTMSSGKRRLLQRQANLPAIVTGADFAANRHLNLIVNLSCCMFRSALMKRLPARLYEPRLSEISLAFHLDQLGGLGFLPEVMSTYRLNDQSVWTGASEVSKHRQAIAAREVALRVARPAFRATIQRHIDTRQQALQAELAKARKTE